MAQARGVKTALSASMRLPRPAMPMRANAAVRERYAMTRVGQLTYTSQKASDKRTRQFVLHDGPPYANGKAHTGHLLNKTVKDVFNRFAMATGKRVIYVPGWDCHGLPIEHKVLEELAAKGAPVERDDAVRLRTAAGTAALQAVAEQAADFERWGVAADWQSIRDWIETPQPTSLASSSGKATSAGKQQESYCTLERQYEAAELRVLRTLMAKGLVYRALRPVHWSPSSGTALAEAELEYSQGPATAVWVRFTVKEQQEERLGVWETQVPDGVLGAGIAAWTTTPWTLPANDALCVHPDMEYVLLRATCDAGPLRRGERLVVAAERVEALCHAMQLTKPQPSSSSSSTATTITTTTTVTAAVASASSVPLEETEPSLLEIVGTTFPGTALIGLQTHQALPPGMCADRVSGKPTVKAEEERESLIVGASHVTADSGTGIVHTAPGHGAEDFEALAALAAYRHGLAGSSGGGVWLPEDAEAALWLSEQAARHVSVAAGTGAVMAVRCPVDGAGMYTASAGSRLQGLEAQGDGQLAVLDALARTGSMPCSLLGMEQYQHRFPIDWRTKQPVMSRATWQWFASASELHELACKALKEVQMVPESGRSRLIATVRGRTAWCISRQRRWGVPIPVHYRNDSQGGQTPIVDQSILRHAETLIGEHGSDAWWLARDGWKPAGDEDTTSSPLLPADTCSPDDELEAGTDTLDVWFDSGSSWLAAWAHRGENSPAVIEPRRAMHVADPECDDADDGDLRAMVGVQADVVVEGSDQHRGWFQSSLLTAVAATGPSGGEEDWEPKAPFKAVVTHGFVLDEHGRKMSKSLGNVVLPVDLIEGAGMGALPSSKDTNLKQRKGSADPAGLPTSGSAAPLSKTQQKKLQKRLLRQEKRKQEEEAKSAKQATADKPPITAPAATTASAGLGADVVRMWAASADYSGDISLAPAALSAASDSLRRVRNVTRYLSGVLSPRDVSLFPGDAALCQVARDSLSMDETGVLQGDLSPLLVKAWESPAAAKPAVSGPIEAVSRHRLRRSAEVCATAIGRDYNTSKAVSELQRLLASTVSAILVDSSKDALYAELSGSQRRQAAELAAWDVLRGVTIMAFPIVPFTAEEVFQTSVPTLLLQHGAEYDSIMQQDRDLVQHPLAPRAVLMDSVHGGEADSVWEQFVPSSWADDHMESPSQWGGVEQLRSMVGKASDRARQDGWLRGELEAKAVICVAQGSEAEQCIDWATDRELWGALRGCEQHDPSGLSQLCDTLRVSAVEIHRVPSSQSPHEAASSIANGEADSAATVVIASDTDAQASSVSHVAVALVKAPGAKCHRCWKIAPTIEPVPDLEGVAVCGRCMDAMLSRS